ncbi:Nif11-like leader peptide family natural product precursor [Mesorhizobium huakuii]|uniref:Nif11 family protein n=1 Tax=Mesorhizobium huakuii TaxID=28104 RepID=A0A7G6T4S7_9HYPH|nr:Nif11-like leader peptide family natural product precursor [Mesorhizobium huakuii]QND61759.1 Nif11 family protein [Mesorhizobium huakuii]QND69295.1 Nif11 family protein [Mesorhizobium loti]
MSRAEVERFVGDLAKNDSLLEKVKPNATGLASVVATGKKHGYNFTLDEAKSYIQSRSPRELTDKQLDAIVGGKHHSSVATSTKVVQTTAVVTTAVEAAEAASTVAEAAEAVVVVAAVLI